MHTLNILQMALVQQKPFVFTRTHFYAKKIMLADASINPSRRQVQYLHLIWKDENLGSFINPLEMLEKKLDLVQI